jgi:predicted nuclease of restriction endonuclease-like RecB superfamily
LEPQIAARLSSLAPGQQLVLDYLVSRDEPWLAWLLTECGRLVGHRLAELRERFSRPLGVPAPKHKLRAALRVLERLLPEQPAREPSPREVRARLFRSAASSSASRQHVIEQIARELGTEAPLLEQALFADLANERRVGAVPADLTASRLSLLVNQALVHNFLKRALRVQIRTWDAGHALLRQARRLGLICVAKAPASRTPDSIAGTAGLAARVAATAGTANAAGTARVAATAGTASAAGTTGAASAAGTTGVAGTAGSLLEISGPFVLFRKTELYGRALASLLPFAARAKHFELLAECSVAGRSTRCTLRITPADPIFAAREPTAFDSRVATRFFRDFARITSPFQIVRDPVPVELGGELFVPDFELFHPEREDLRYRFELIGFWTPEYLRHRLARMSAAGEQRFVLCLDEARGCSDAAPPDDARLFRYKSRLSAEKLLAFIGARHRQAFDDR